MTHTRTVIAEANQLFREGLQRLLEATRFEVCGQARSLKATVDLMPDLADVQLVIFDFAEAASDSEMAALLRLRSEYPRVKLVLLTEVISDELMTNCVRLRLDGYLPKNLSPDALNHSLNLILLGVNVYPPELMARRSLAPAPKARSVADETGGLSTRELEVVRCLMAGDPNKLIAKRLEIQEATVKVHLKSILRKLKVANRTQAALWAREHGIGTTAQAAE